MKVPKHWQTISKNILIWTSFSNWEAYVSWDEHSDLLMNMWLAGRSNKQLPASHNWCSDIFTAFLQAYLRCTRAFWSLGDRWASLPFSVVSLSSVSFLSFISLLRSCPILTCYPYRVQLFVLTSFCHSFSTSSFTHTSLHRGRLNKTDLCWQSILNTNVAKQQVTLLMPSYSYSSLFAVTVQSVRGTVLRAFLRISSIWQL